MTSDQLAGLVVEVPALRAPVDALTPDDPSPAAIAAAVEFVLEGLHLSKRLNKDDSGTSATYRGRL
jgi:magnesium chelatase subunit I